VIDSVSHPCGEKHIMKRDVATRGTGTSQGHMNVFDVHGQLIYRLNTVMKIVHLDFMVTFRLGYTTIFKI